jgi:hypothetical protein
MNDDNYNDAICDEILKIALEKGGIVLFDYLQQFDIKQQLHIEGLLRGLATQYLKSENGNYYSITKEGREFRSNGGFKEKRIKDAMDKEMNIKLKEEEKINKEREIKDRKTSKIISIIALGISIVLPLIIWYLGVLHDKSKEDNKQQIQNKMQQEIDSLNVRLNAHIYLDSLQKKKTKDSIRPATLPK